MYLDLFDALCRHPATSNETIETSLVKNPMGTFRYRFQTNRLPAFASIILRLDEEDHGQTSIHGQLMLGSTSIIDITFTENIDDWENSYFYRADAHYDLIAHIMEALEDACPEAMHQFIDDILSEDDSDSTDEEIIHGVSRNLYLHGQSTLNAVANEDGMALEEIRRLSFADTLIHVMTAVLASTPFYRTFPLTADTGWAMVYGWWKKGSVRLIETPLPILVKGQPPYRPPVDDLQMHLTKDQKRNDPVVGNVKKLGGIEPWLDPPYTYQIAKVVLYHVATARVFHDEGGFTDQYLTPPIEQTDAWFVALRFLGHLVPMYYLPEDQLYIPCNQVKHVTLHTLPTDRYQEHLTFRFMERESIRID